MQTLQSVLLPLEDLSFAPLSPEVPPSQRETAKVALPGKDLGGGELLLLVDPLPHSATASAGRHKLSGLTKARRYEASSLFSNACPLGAPPFTKFRTENFLSRSSSCPLPSKRNTRLIDRRSRNRLDTLETER